jgi:type I restriction enzyme S subunit
LIEGLKPYPEYKKSGLPWLDTVPKHWDMVPNRALMRDKRQVVGAKASEYTLLSLTLRGVIARDMVNPKGKFPAQFNAYKVVRPKDFVFCLFDIDETPRGVGLSPLKGMITGAYDIFSPTHRVNPRFLYHYYLFVDEGKLMKPLYTGLRKTIQRGVFASLKAPLPPPNEQGAIVRFLDHANRKIDGFVRAKRKLIGLLNEQKQAIIHRAVTRGLRPDVPLKPSGIPWLGDIPAHWEMSRACRVFRQVTRYFATGDELKMSMSRHYGLVRSSELSNRAAQAATSIKFSVCIPGDLVLNKYQAHNGLFGAATEKGLITSNYSVFKPLHGACTPYFSALFASPTYRGEFRMRCQGVGDGMMPLYSDAFLKTPTIAPPMAEQQAIVAYLIQATKSVTETIARTEREIALMQEYRTRLTADLVTGKLDVREAAAKLPDLPLDAAEPVPEDEEALEGLEVESA